jgi:hypothetical protein
MPNELETQSILHQFLPEKTQEEKLNEVNEILKKYSNHV